MKKLLALCSLLFAVSAFSQEITFEKGKFYQNGAQLSTFETKNIIKSNSEAYQYFKTAKTKEGLGGFLLGLGIGLTVGDVVKGLVSDATYPSGFTYVGAGCIAASIPILSERKKKIEKAIELYNKGLTSLKDSSDAFNYNLNVISNTNGYGIQVSF